jgi:hypothetical protein
MGLLQWLLLQHRFVNAWWWIIATTAGWSFGSFLVMNWVPAGMDFLTGLVTGAALGFAQWLFLRPKLSYSVWWIVINIVAWTTGFALLPGILLTGVIVAVLTGTCLCLLLLVPKSLPMGESTNNARI